MKNSSNEEQNEGKKSERKVRKLPRQENKERFY
jgi:hypothetical protein